MKVEVRPATLRDACFVTANMRPADWREIEAVIPGLESSHLAAWALEASQGEAFVAYLNDQPAVLMGLVPVYVGVKSGWAWGTRHMRRCVPEMTRFCRSRWAWHLENGVRRIEVRTAIDHDLSHRWLPKLGAKVEGVCRHHGDGLDFVLYALTRD